MSEGEIMREAGFYWVIWISETNLTIAEWDGRMWSVIGDECGFSDRSFSYIDERRIVREGEQ